MENDYRKFSLRLKEERTRCSLTQQQLCGCTEMQQSAFSRVETGFLRHTDPIPGTSRNIIPYMPRRLT